MININKIKPKIKGQSDKYSWNLYRFLNKLIKDKDEGKYIKNQLEVLWLYHSRWDGEYLEFDESNLNTRQLIIVPLGLNNSRSFYSMDSILREGKSERFYMPWKKEDLCNITEWFFDTYEKDGRCIFDREHDGWMLGVNDRFTYVNNTRKCNWCGKWQYKEIHKEIKIKRHEVWV